MTAVAHKQGDGNIVQTEKVWVEGDIKLKMTLQITGDYGSTIRAIYIGPNI